MNSSTSPSTSPSRHCSVSHPPPSAAIAQPLSPSAIAAEAARARRRVKPEKRKRSAISCDLCKIKRIKCKREKVGDACEACIKSKVDCTHDVPRKVRRVFGIEAAALYHDDTFVSSSALITQPSDDHLKGPRRPSIEGVDRAPERPLGFGQHSDTPSRQSSSSSVSPTPGGLTTSNYRGASSTSARATASHGATDSDPPVGPPNADTSPTSFAQLGTAPSDSRARDGSTDVEGRHPESGLWSAQTTPRTSITSGPETDGSALSPGLLQTDLRGRPRYVGPSASLHFFAQLRDIMSKYEPNSEFVRNGLARALASFEDPFESSAKRQEAKSQRTKTADRRGHVEGVSAHHSSTIGGAWPSREWKGLLKTGPLKMPARWLADTLVEAFFTRFHGDFVVFHRATFWCRYESMWTSSSAVSSSENDPVWTCSVCMVLVLGASAIMGNVAPYDLGGASRCGVGRQKKKNSVRSHAQDSALSIPATHPGGPARLSLSTLKGIQRRYYQHVEALLPRVLCGSSLANVQAILLVAVYIHNEDEREATWNLTGSAVRMAFATGLHRKEGPGGQLPSEFGTLEREMRKRLWWTLFAFERFLCSSLGRPSSIDDNDVDAELPKDSILDTSDQGPLGYLSHSVSLFQLVGRICKTIYNPIHQLQDKTAAALAILGELRTWRNGVPSHLELGMPQIPTHRRALLLLYIQYHNAVSLLTRPFLILETNQAGSSGLEHPSSGETGDGNPIAQAKLAHICVESAQACVALLQTLQTEGLFNATTWFDTWWTYSSAMILAMPVIWKRGCRPSRDGEQTPVRPETAAGRNPSQSYSGDCTEAESLPEPVKATNATVLERAEACPVPAELTGPLSPPVLLMAETAERAKKDFQNCLDLLDGLALRGTLARFAEVMNNLAKAVGVSVSLQKLRQEPSTNGRPPRARERTAEHVVGRAFTEESSPTSSEATRTLPSETSQITYELTAREGPQEPAAGAAFATSQASQIPGRNDIMSLISPSSANSSPTDLPPVRRPGDRTPPSSSRLSPLSTHIQTQTTTKQMVGRNSLATGDTNGLPESANASNNYSDALSAICPEQSRPQIEGDGFYDEWASVFDLPTGHSSALSFAQPGCEDGALWDEQTSQMGGVVGSGEMGGSGAQDERTAWEMAMNWNWDQISSALLQAT